MAIKLRSQDNKKLKEIFASYLMAKPFVNDDLKELVFTLKNDRDARELFRKDNNEGIRDFIRRMDLAEDIAFEIVQEGKRFGREDLPDMVSYAMLENKHIDEFREMALALIGIMGYNAPDDTVRQFFIDTLDKNWMPAVKKAIELTEAQAVFEQLDYEYDQTPDSEQKGIELNQASQRVNDLEIEFNDVILSTEIRRADLEALENNEISRLLNLAATGIIYPTHMTQKSKQEGFSYESYFIQKDGVDEYEVALKLEGPYLDKSYYDPTENYFSKSEFLNEERYRIDSFVVSKILDSEVVNVMSDINDYVVLKSKTIPLDEESYRKIEKLILEETIYDHQTDILGYPCLPGKKTCLKKDFDFDNPKFEPFKPANFFNQDNSKNFKSVQEAREGGIVVRKEFCEQPKVSATKQEKHNGITR